MNCNDELLNFVSEKVKFWPATIEKLSNAKVVTQLST